MSYYYSLTSFLKYHRLPMCKRDLFLYSRIQKCTENHQRQSACFHRKRFGLAPRNLHNDFLQHNLGRNHNYCLMHIYNFLRCIWVRVLCWTRKGSSSHWCGCHMSRSCRLRRMGCKRLNCLYRQSKFVDGDYCQNKRLRKNILNLLNFREVEMFVNEHGLDCDSSIP